MAFEGGDPDRPMIVGSVYNSKNAPPYPMPLSAYISGFKSCTERGNPLENYHNILMKDGSADKNIAIHAESSVVTTQESNTLSLRPRFDISVTG